MPLAVPELIWFALLLFAFAVVYTLRKFIEALFTPLIHAFGWVPVVGATIADGLRATESAVSSALGSAEGRIDQAIGASFHALAELTNWLWRELKAHATLLAAICAPIGVIISAIHAIRALVHQLHRGAHAVRSSVARLEKEYHGIEHRVKTLERDITKGIGHDLRIQVRGLEKELTHVENVVIPNVRGIAQTAENDVSALRKWVTDNVPLIGTATFVGAIAAALSALGLGWLRCNSNPFNNNKNACGLWGELADLLAIAAIPLELASLYELIGIAQNVTEEIVTVAEDVLKV